MVVAAVVAVTVSACGSHQAAAIRPADQTLKQCHQQWADVARSVKGLDQDTNPSALASRWTTVLATIDYYETSTTATGCQANISSQVAAITTLREFSAKLRPYDMVYQLAQVAATVDSYQAAPLPKPVRMGKKKGKGKLVHPPTKAAVQAALVTLQADAATADAALAPAWSEMASVELTNATAVSSALQDLDFVAQDSADWKRCEAALQVIVAAQHALAGETGTSGSLPDGTPTTTPSSTPTASPTASPTGPATPSSSPSGSPTG
ncbi:MAG: hypothetical protein JWP74_2375 [Marmoricola sp.]|nr:hypothetical protein [Marmoricola sp.]